MTLTRRDCWLFAGAIFLLAFFVFGRALGSDFVFWDDTLLILDQPISHGLSIQHLAQAFTTYDPDLYVPLTFLSFQINYAIAGLHPSVYHLTNLLLHAGSAVLVGWIALQLSRRRFVAMTAALFFLVHPINVEAVAWASARKDVLSSFFFLLSLAQYLHWRDTGRSKNYAVSIIAFLCGLLSKASILPLPFILLLCGWYRTRRITRGDIMGVLPYVGLSAVFGVIAMFGKAGGQVSLVEKMFLGAESAFLSLLHLMLPLNLSILYPYAGPVSVLNPDLLLSAAGIAVISIAVILLRKKFPALLFGWFWFLLLLAPSFFTVEKGQDLVPEVYLTSDRYVYLAAIGLFFIDARILHEFRRRYRTVITGLVAIVLILLAALSFHRSGAWVNTETLLLDALAKNPESAIAHNNLGAFYDAQGKSDDALREYQAAVSGGGTGDAWFNLGVTFMQRKQSVEAIGAFAKAVELRPHHLLAQLNLGALLTDAGNVTEGVEHLLKAQALDPGNVSIYLNLGIALEKGQNPSDAIRAYERALQLDSANAFAAERLQALRKP